MCVDELFVKDEKIVLEWGDSHNPKTDWGKKKVHKDSVEIKWINYYAEQRIILTHDCAVLYEIWANE